MFNRKKEEVIAEPVLDCDKGMQCDECPERFRCFTEKKTKYQSEVVALRKELVLVLEELKKANFAPRKKALTGRQTDIMLRLEKINTIVGTLGVIEQTSPPAGWHAGMITNASSTGDVDKRLGHDPSESKFISTIPKRVAGIYNDFIHNFSEGNIVVFANTKDVYRKWNATPFEAKLFLCESEKWYYLVGWTNEEE